MAVNIRGRSFLKLLDYTPAEIRYLLDLSKNFKDMKRAGVPHRWLEGKNIVLLFEKDSVVFDPSIVAASQKGHEVLVHLGDPIGRACPQ